MTKAQELAQQLRNISLLTAQKLLNIGIDNLEKLRSLGIKKIYLQLCYHQQLCGVHNPVYLYALEGAILNCDWRQLPSYKKEEYKAFPQQLRVQFSRKKKNNLQA